MAQIERRNPLPDHYGINVGGLRVVTGPELIHPKDGETELDGPTLRNYLYSGNPADVLKAMIVRSGLVFRGPEGQAPSSTLSATVIMDERELRDPSGGVEARYPHRLAIIVPANPQDVLNVEYPEGPGLRIDELENFTEFTLPNEMQISVFTRNGKATSYKSLLQI